MALAVIVGSIVAGTAIVGSNVARGAVDYLSRIFQEHNSDYYRQFSNEKEEVYPRMAPGYKCTIIPTPKQYVDSQSRDSSAGAEACDLPKGGQSWAGRRYLGTFVSPNGKTNYIYATPNGARVGDMPQHL